MISVKTQIVLVKIVNVVKIVNAHLKTIVDVTNKKNPYKLMYGFKKCCIYFN
jgi:hypothetical protein